MSRFVDKLLKEPSRLDINSGWNSGSDFKTQEYTDYAQTGMQIQMPNPWQSNNVSNDENMTCENWVLKKTGGYAQAYVPYQETLNLVSGNKGIVCGTIFADLIKPYKKPAPNASLS